jgi:hypothetical protein
MDEFVSGIISAQDGRAYISRRENGGIRLLAMSCYGFGVSLLLTKEQTDELIAAIHAGDSATANSDDVTAV